MSPGGGARERKKRRRGGGAGREREKASREGPVSRKVWRIRDCSVDYLLKSFVCFWFPSFAAARAFSSCGVGHHPPPWRAHSSLPWPLRLQSAGSRHVGSAVPAHGLRCPEACGVFLDQASNQCLLHQQTDSYILPPGTSSSDSLHHRITEKATATHSSPLAWEIAWTEEPGGLPSVGSHRVGHD